MSKKQALTEFHRGSILAAAERLFSEKGTEKTTMDDIAREAEYSKATLYVYFQSKEEIISAILLNGLILLRKKLGEAIEGHETWVEAYNAACEAIIRFYGENPTAYNAISGEMEISPDAQGSKGLQDIQRTGDEINEILSAFLERGIQEGVVRSDLPVRDMVPFFWAAISGIVRAVERRNTYLNQAAGLDRPAFLAHGVQLVLDAFTKT
ncbi:MAG: TetR/AcrR family transcriptional regulator [Oscillospiraceae bacterium]|nr:TetR/AcrR family transcriptional regulator [Oscillospiraceae bacterium]